MHKMHKSKIYVHVLLYNPGNIQVISGTHKFHWILLSILKSVLFGYHSHFSFCGNVIFLTIIKRIYTVNVAAHSLPALFI